MCMECHRWVSTRRRGDSRFRRPRGFDRHPDLRLPANRNSSRAVVVTNEHPATVARATAILPASMHGPKRDAVWIIEGCGHTILSVPLSALETLLHSETDKWKVKVQSSDPEGYDDHFVPKIPEGIA
ncbi:hypothetical protein SKAU_G00082790 [Synaphobranchus kaupii]|uniref:Uncharacterized protein n=1 Tax=Synaphobranchus kaupii TaxID=118154 RepID=A0A9Q1J5P0_SYNKA|nr:hypothetical protein SKAU_G00082790 [Synaphobranchus kaupii]